MFMFKSNEPIKIGHLQKLANQSLLNSVLLMEMVNIYIYIYIYIYIFDKAEKVLIEKNKDMKIYFHQILLGTTFW